MNKWLLVTLALVLLAAGCVPNTVAPATPAAAPTAEPTQAPTAGPTVAAVEPPTAAATDTAVPITAPTAAPAPTATTAALQSPLATPQSPLPTPGNANSPVPTPSGVRGQGGTLTVMTHDSFSVSKDVVAKFEQQCGCQVSFLKSGDAGLALNKAILSKDHPLADVFYGVDNTFLSRALKADIFEPYASPSLDKIPSEFRLDPTNRLLPVDYGYVNLNYDKSWFEQHKLPVPQTLRDLTKPEYKGLLVTENPATSSPGLAFLLTTVGVFKPSDSYNFVKFWQDLRNNDVLVVDGWENAYNQQFSAGPGKGDRPLVVSYATSPAAEVYFANPQPQQSPTGNILPEGQSFRQVEFVGLLKGAARPDLGREWIDFMLGDTFQADIPLQMWVYPVRTGTPLPDVFTRFAQIPQEAVQMPPQTIDANRDAWLKTWTDTVLR